MHHRGTQRQASSPRLVHRYAHHLDLLPRLVVFVHLDILNVMYDVQTTYRAAKDPAHQRDLASTVGKKPTCACRSTMDMARS